MPRARLSAALVVALSLATAAIARAQHPLAGDDSPRDARPFVELSRSASALRDSLIVSVTRLQIGTRYVRGGETPDGGFDCSGLVRYIMAALSVKLPRTAAQQARRGVTVPRDLAALKPGDLLTFGRGNRITHIGVYVGGGRFVHASTTSGKVIETSLTRRTNPLVRSWRGVRRLVAAVDSGETGAARP